MNAELLHRLRSASGGFLTWDEVGQDGMGADLDEIERLGFLVERHPILGVSYRGPSPRLCPDQIEWRIDTKVVGRRVAVWNRVASTNDLATAAAGSIANDGLVILAEEQTRGRGRRGRAWQAPPRSCVLMSVLLFPSGPIAGSSWLTALGAVAAAEVVEAETGLPARIKWPNDVRIEGRKIAGVLVERNSGVVIGLGLNVMIGLEDFPEALRTTATSLQILTAEVHDRSEIARALIRRLDHHYVIGQNQGTEVLAKAWRDRLEPIGRDVSIVTRSGTITGRLVDADLVRGLHVVTGDGQDTWIGHPEVIDIDGDSGPILNAGSTRTAS